MFGSNWIRQAAERLQFWKLSRARDGVPFWYMSSSGSSIGLESYSVLTDEVTYRPGQFGTSGFGPYPAMGRQEFLALGEKGYTDLRAERAKPAGRANLQQA